VLTKTKIITVVSISILAFFVIASPQPVSARDLVRMKQRIKPIPCGIDHLTDANGVDHYFAPRACGKLVRPSSGISGNSGSASGGGQAVTGTTPIYLDIKNHMVGDDAYLLLAKKGQVYTFRLKGDSMIAPLRTLEVTQVAKDKATIMFTPGDKEATLPVGGRIDADVAFGQDPDVNIRVKSISSDALVAMQVWFPLQRELIGTVGDTMHSTLATGIIGGLVVTAGYLHFHTRRRLRR
jgi:hypothetical protein